MYQHITDISANNSGDNLILENTLLFCTIAIHNGEVYVMNTNYFIEGKERKKINTESKEIKILYATHNTSSYYIYTMSF